MAEAKSKCHCCVPQCKTNKQRQPYLSFHGFPGDRTERKKWFEAIRRDEGQNLTILRGSTFVCSLHFNEEDFTPTTGRKRLKIGAVPSRFHWNSWGLAQRESVSEKETAPAGHDAAAEPSVTDSLCEDISPAVTLTFGPDHDYAAAPTPGIKKDRLCNIAKYWVKNGVPMPENRGGARNSNEKSAKRQIVRDHIKTFICRASHYARRGAPGRKYLPADLNVKKMHELFCRQNDEQITYALYYSVFTYDFNLAFGHPSKDMCSTCVKSRLNLKNPELTDEERRTESGLYLLHRRRGRKFYDLLNAVEDTFTISFDVMQSLVPPKSPVSQTYCSRQLHQYVFCVVRHRGRGQNQRKEDIHFFTWLQSDSEIDSNMVASALQYYLGTVVQHKLGEQNTLRLFSDSCYGQNENISVLSMLFALQNQKFKDLRINYTFAIRGHSFLPPDRVFGRLEQEIRKKDTILLPSEYLEIMEGHGNIHVYGEHWQCYDFKTAAAKHCSSTRSFKMSDARVLEICGDKLGFKQQYSADICYHSVLKCGKKWDTFIPAVVPRINCVKEAKKANVLKQLGALDAASERIQQLEAKVQMLETERTQLKVGSLYFTKFCVSDEDIRFYTRFPSKEIFHSFWEAVRPSASMLVYWSKAQEKGQIFTPASSSPIHSLQLIDEFFLYCCCVAAGLKEKVLADIFQISVSTVSSIVITWANYLYLLLSSSPIWMSKEQVKSTMPPKCRQYSPEVRVIIDCTEVRCQSISSLAIQSDNPNTTTYKGLVGIAPCGAVTFVSSLYSGSISDQELTERCGILDLLEEGDGCITDKGLTIERMLPDRGERVIITPFQTSAQLSKEDTLKTQAIARLRTLVERAIRRVKEYHIWDDTLPVSLSGTVNQLWISCCLMSNFQGPL